MAAKRYSVPPRPQLSQAELQRLERRQAEERLRRGMTDFSRPARRESVYGVTPGESKMGTAQRESQRKRKK